MLLGNHSGSSQQTGSPRLSTCGSRLCLQNAQSDGKRKAEALTNRQKQLDQLQQEMQSLRRQSEDKVTIAGKETETAQHQVCDAHVLHTVCQL